MTEQPFRKNIIAFSIFSVAAVIAVLYGFSLVTSPFELQLMKYDETRVLDLDKLKSEINNYYKKSRNLPQSLNEIPDMPSSGSYSYSSTSGPVSKIDPQTQMPYEYIVIDNYNYKLCATFSASNMKFTGKDDYDYYMSTNYKYRNIMNDYRHTQGRNCFTGHAYYSNPSDYDDEYDPADYDDENVKMMPTPTALQSVSPYPSTVCMGYGCPNQMTPTAPVSPTPTYIQPN